MEKLILQYAELKRGITKDNNSIASKNNELIALEDKLLDAVVKNTDIKETLVQQINNTITQRRKELAKAKYHLDRKEYIQAYNIFAGIPSSKDFDIMNLGNTIAAINPKSEKQIWEYKIKNLKLCENYNRRLSLHGILNDEKRVFVPENSGLIILDKSDGKEIADIFCDYPIIEAILDNGKIYAETFVSIFALDIKKAIEKNDDTGRDHFDWINRKYPNDTFSLAKSKNHLFLATNKGVYKIDTGTGEMNPIKEFATSIISAHPEEKRIFALYPFRYNLISLDEEGEILWKRHTSHYEIKDSPKLSNSNVNLKKTDENLYLIQDRGTLLSINPDNGEMKWKKELPDYIFNIEDKKDITIAYALDDNRITKYRIDANSGKILDHIIYNKKT